MHCVVSEVRVVCCVVAHIGITPLWTRFVVYQNFCCNIIMCSTTHAAHMSQDLRVDHQLFVAVS